eukprot:538632_1
MQFYLQNTYPNNFRDIVSIYMLMVQFQKKYSLQSKNAFVQFTMWISNHLETSSAKVTRTFIRHHFGPSRQVKSDKIQNMLKSCLKSGNVFAHKIILRTKHKTGAKRTNANDVKKAVSNYKRKIENCWTRAGPALFSACNSKAQLTHIRGILVRYCSDAPKIPSAKTAEASFMQYCNDKTIINGDETFKYISKTPIRDPTADKLMLGSFTDINKESFEASATFNIFITEMPFRNKTIKDLKLELLNCPRSCIEADAFYKQLQIQIFNVSENDKRVRWTSEEFAIPQHHRVEFRFGCADNENARHLFSALKRYSEIKNLYGTKVDLYGPKMPIKVNRVTVRDPKSFFIAHLRESIGSNSEFDASKYDVYFSSHFDGIGKMHAMCPFDIHAVCIDRKSNDYRITTQTPFTLWAGGDHEFSQHVPAVLLDIFQALDHLAKKNIYFNSSKDNNEKKPSKGFQLSTSNFLLGSDGKPRCKYTKIKGAGHPCRYVFNLQHENYVAVVWIQNRQFYFRLKQFWRLWFIQLMNELGKAESEIDKNQQYMSGEPTFFEFRLTIPSLGEIFVKVAFFHACARTGEVSTAIIKHIVDINCGPYKKILNGLFKYRDLNGKGQGAKGAQKLFHALYKMGYTLSTYIKPEFKSFGHYMQIITVGIRYYDTCVKTSRSLQILMLLYGALAYSNTGILSEKIGGQEDTGKSHLIGLGSPKFMDFCLHGHIMCMELDVSPGPFNERRNENGMRLFADVKNKVNQVQPIEKIGMETTVAVAVKEKKKYKRRRSSNIDCPQPSDLYVHNCYLKNLFALRVMIQYFWVLNDRLPTWNKSMFIFNDNGTFYTNSGFVDDDWEDPFVISCICGNASEINNNTTSELTEIPFEQFSALLKSKLAQLSTFDDQIINLKFPGLSDNMNIKTEEAKLEQKIQLFQKTFDQSSNGLIIYEQTKTECCEATNPYLVHILCDNCEKRYHCRCINVWDGPFTCNNCESNNHNNINI